MAIALLAGDIPELKTNDGVFVVPILLHVEIDANSSLHIIQEHIFDIPLQNAGLTACGLTHNQDLEAVFVLSFTLSSHAHTKRKSDFKLRSEKVGTNDAQQQTPSPEDIVY